MASKLNKIINSADKAEQVGIVLMETQDHLKAKRKAYLDIASNTTSHKTYKIYMYKYQQVDNQIAKIDLALNTVTTFLPLPS